MEFDLKSKIYKSSIDKDFMVIVTTKIFNFMKNDIAICDLNKKTIIINGKVTKKLTNNHFLCIEAHEISHYIAKHDKYGDDIFEKEADKMAYIILLFKGKLKAARIIRERFESHYNLNLCRFSIRKILYYRIFKFFLKKLFMFEP